MRMICRAGTLQVDNLRDLEEPWLQKMKHNLNINIHILKEISYDI